MKKLFKTIQLKLKVIQIMIIIILVLLAVPLIASAETQTEKNLADLKYQTSTIVKILCLDGHQFVVASSGNRSGVSVVQVFYMSTKSGTSSPKTCKTKPALPYSEAEIKAQALRDAAFQSIINNFGKNYE